MAWSKVSNKHKKPLSWWYDKLMCELVWFLGDRGKYYYKYLNNCCDLGFNLYGEKI